MLFFNKRSAILNALIFEILRTYTSLSFYLQAPNSLYFNELRLKLTRMCFSVASITIDINEIFLLNKTLHEIF